MRGGLGSQTTYAPVQMKFDTLGADETYCARILRGFRSSVRVTQPPIKLSSVPTLKAYATKGNGPLLRKSLRSQEFVRTHLYHLV